MRVCHWLLAAVVVLAEGQLAAAQDVAAANEDSQEQGEPQTIPTDEDEREAELFGESSTSDEEREAEIFGGTPAVASPLDETGLGESIRDVDIFERLADEEDRLDIGGLVFLRLSYLALDKGRFRDFSVTSANFADMYLDSRPSDHVRLFLRGRLTHDPSLETNKSSVALDQFWIKFDHKRSVFVTLGRQRIKWGTGRFWNPTDFLNSETLDPLSRTIFDERLGVSLAKVHLPVESLGANLYALATFDGASEAADIGCALRGEVVLETSELSASVAARRGTPIRLGADYSGAIGPLDVKVEVALQHGVKTPFYRGRLDTSPLRLEEFDIDGVLAEELPDALLEQLPAVLESRRPESFLRDKDWIPQVVAGLEYARNYTDDDAVYLGAEYFFDDLGYRNSKLYPVLFESGTFRPFYTGRHYAAVYASMPQPGTWNDTSLTLSGLANLSDRSVIPRLDYSLEVRTHLTFNAFFMVHVGKQGEFNYSYEQGPLLEPSIAAQIPKDRLDSIPPAVLEGVSIVGPLFTAGAGLRGDF